MGGAGPVIHDGAQTMSTHLHTSNRALLQDGAGRLRRRLESIEKELQAADDAAQAAGLSASSMVALQVRCSGLLTAAQEIPATSTQASCAE